MTEPTNDELYDMDGLKFREWLFAKISEGTRRAIKNG